MKYPPFVSFQKESFHGLEALLFKDQSLPYIRFSLFFPFKGAAFGPRPGLSKAAFYLLDQGAGAHSAAALQERLSYYGTAFEADVGRMGAEASLSGLSEHAASLWELFSAIVFEPHFKPSELRRLKPRLIQARRRLLDSKSAVCYEAFLSALFKAAPPLAQPISGDMASLKALKISEIRSFYNAAAPLAAMAGKGRAARPAAVLSVVGKWDSSLKRLIRGSLLRSKPAFASFLRSAPSRLDGPFKGASQSSAALGFFAGKARGASSGKGDVPAGRGRGGGFYLLTKDDLSQAEVCVGFPAPSFRQESARSIAAFRLASAVFGGRGGSRLMTQLRERQGLTYGVYARRALMRDEGFVVISGATGEQSAARFLSGILTLLERFRQRGISKAELERAKAQVRSEFLLNSDGLEARAAQFIHYKHGLGAPLSFLSQYIGILQSVSLEEANEAIQAVVPPIDEALCVVFGPKRMERSLQAVRPISKTEAFESRFKAELLKV